MDKVSVVLRVFFEDPFWIGILERVESGRMTVCKITFGPEPKDCEVHGFLAKEYYGPVSYTHLDVYKRQVQKLCVEPISVFCRFV